MTLHPPARISVQIRVTVPLDTLRGHGDEPGELAGYGPITADQARELAAGADTWQRLITDPLSGTLLDHGTTRYRPPPQLAEFIRTRDHTCGHPGCRVPAHRCDLDHTIPFGAGGPTSAANLKTTCRSHHRLKQTPGWRVTQHEDGTITWTTPQRTHLHLHPTTPPPPDDRPGTTQPAAGRAPVLSPMPGSARPRRPAPGRVTSPGIPMPSIETGTALCRPQASGAPARTARWANRDVAGRVHPQLHSTTNGRPATMPVAHRRAAVAEGERVPRTLVLDGPCRIRLSEQPSRPLRPGEVRLRSLLSGISHGTELSLYRGTSAFDDKVFDRGLRAFVAPPAGNASAYPVTLGYEMVSTVAEVGPDVTEVAVGDLVHTGTPHQEETVLDVAASLRATYPLVVLPTTERPERALFLSLAAVALQAVHDAQIKLGDAVSVHGLGAIGLLTIQMCRLDGIQNIVAVDPDPHRRRLAARFGATHVLDPNDPEPLAVRIRELNEGRGMDVAIEVSGTDRGLQGALAAAGLGGTVVAAGFYQGGAAHLRLGEEFHHNRLSLIASVGAWGAPHRHAPLWDRRRVLDTAIHLLYGERLSVDGMLDRCVPFDDAPSAYRALDEHPQGSVKTALTYPGPGVGSLATSRPAG